MVELNSKIIFNEGNIKTLSIIADNDIVFLDVINKIIKVLPMNIGLYGCSIIKSDCGDVIVIPFQSSGFNIQIDCRFSEFWK